MEEKYRHLENSMYFKPKGEEKVNEAETISEMDENFLYLKDTIQLCEKKSDRGWRDGSARRGVCHQD